MQITSQFLVMLSFCELLLFYSFSIILWATFYNTVLVSFLSYWTNICCVFWPDFECCAHLKFVQNDYFIKNLFQPAFGCVQHQKAVQNDFFQWFESMLLQKLKISILFCFLTFFFSRLLMRRTFHDHSLEAGIELVLF